MPPPPQLSISTSTSTSPVPKDAKPQSPTSTSPSSPTSLITQVDENQVQQSKKQLKQLHVPASAVKQNTSTSNSPLSGSTNQITQHQQSIAAAQQQLLLQQQQQNGLTQNQLQNQHTQHQRRRPTPSWKRFLFGCCGFHPRDLEAADVAPHSPPSSSPVKPISTLTVSSATTANNNPHILKSAQYGQMGNGQPYLLPLLEPCDIGKKCLVLDLDETLVHSSFKAVPNADFVIPIEIDNQLHNVYVLKRPGVDTFMQQMGQQFEIVVFTASLSKYADPVLDMLDKYKVVKHRLFREACLHHKGNYVKDLNLLGRDIKDIIILDNSPVSYIFHPSNAIPISSWFNDPNDTELLDLIPFLEDLKTVVDVTTVLSQEAL